MFKCPITKRFIFLILRFLIIFEGSTSFDCFSWLALTVLPTLSSLVLDEILISGELSVEYVKEGNGDDVIHPVGKAFIAFVILLAIFTIPE